MRMDFIIQQEPTGLITSAKLRIKHNRVPTQIEIMSGAIYTFEVNIGGAWFLAFLRGGNAFGAMARPPWWTDHVRAEVLNIPPRSG